MNENSDLLPNLLHEEFEMQMRGYSRRQVDDFVARRNNEIRELEQRLARSLDDSEHLRRELSTVRQQALSGRPAHEEVSERISQILKLADDEAKAQKNKADDDIANQRADAQQEADRVKSDAREQAERMLTAAQEQAERTISAARNEADKTRTAARTEADRLTSDTRKKADAAMAQAKSQAKKVLDEATARATAIHDGAERRLNLLSTRHVETVRRLSDILDGVQGLVAAEAARMSMEEEVNQTVSRAVALSEAADAAAATAGEADGGDNLDLALLAPPAPETVANGTVAPPRAEDVRQGVPARPGPAGNGFGGRLSAPAQQEGHDEQDEASSLGGLLPPSGPARGQLGRPGPVTPAPQLSAGQGRHGGSTEDNGSRSQLPVAGGVQSLGNGDRGYGDRGYGDRALGDLGMSDRDPLGDRDPRRGNGLIDPDEPTEGIRLI
jgi:cell division septum initiation protein DivIVA